ncbi:MAG: hypothetical protein M3N53_01860 [Actinomycetota bacterium]|nr:hypothetical protein [Actinomycetota bacterium]
MSPEFLRAVVEPDVQDVGFGNVGCSGCDRAGSMSVATGILYLDLLWHRGRTHGGWRMHHTEQRREESQTQYRR